MFDEKFRQNKLRYVFQCLLATLSVFVVLLILDAMTDAAVIASLGATSFIVFTMPEAHLSRSRFLIGGYLVGIAAGGLCYYLSLVPSLAQLPIVREIPYVVFGALAVGLAISVMVITDTEHPPAAGLALGLVLDEYNHRTVAVVLIGVVALFILKTLLKPVLKDLL